MTSVKPRSAPISRDSADELVPDRVPFGSQNAEPGETSENWNSSSSRPELAVVARPRLLEALELGRELLLA